MKSDGRKLPHQVVLVLALVCAAFAPRAADAQSICDDCQVQVGLGGTYHYWGETLSDFASQLGLRFPFPATFTVRLNSGLFGLGRQEHYPIDRRFAVDRSLIASTTDFRGEPLA